MIFFAFPFSDLSATKVRPALVLQTLRRQDMITCQISSREYADPNAVRIGTDAFAQGGLPLVSYAQAGKLFTANASLVRRSAGRVRETVLNDIIERVVKALRGERDEK